MQILTPELKSEIADKFGLEYKCLNAVMLVESAGSGFDKSTGLIKIQFEPYWFQKFTGIRVANGVEGQKQEWAAYDIAFKQNPDAAMKSTSWGLGQVMGFNCVAAGYWEVKEMVDAFEESEYNQIIGMISFISDHQTMMNALKDKEWAVFAYQYNGPNYKINDYDNKLKAAYDRS
jgi:hypothetical protein